MKYFFNSLIGKQYIFDVIANGNMEEIYVQGHNYPLCLLNSNKILTGSLYLYKPQITAFYFEIHYKS